MNLQVHSTCVALVVDLRSSLLTVTGQRKSRVMRSLNRPRKQKIPLPKDVAETMPRFQATGPFPPRKLHRTECGVPPKHRDDDRPLRK